MILRRHMSSASATCSQCGAYPADGRIFCDKCGATLQTPISFVTSDSTDTTVGISSLKHATILVIKGIGAIAALVFWFSRITTNTGILLFGASIVVGFLCVIALSYLDDDFLGGTGKNGYWPKPLDWGRARNNTVNDKPTDSSRSV
jgi:hypothetical protein